MGKVHRVAIPQTTNLKSRLLRRRVIIRRYDYDLLYGRALGLFEGQTLYDRAEFTPLTRDSLEKQNLVLILKGQASWDRHLSTKYPIHLLTRFRDYLYDPAYLKWTCTWDTEGLMWIQSRRNTPRTELGWAVFEKDLVACS